MTFIIQNVSKSFPGVQALNDISISLMPGEIHALVGENGAGKSTLIKIITGSLRPDSGKIHLDSRPIELCSPRDAIRYGISTVHQERHLISHFSIAENIFLECLPVRYMMVDHTTVDREARKYLDIIGLNLDPHMDVRRLSVAQMQMVEIAKALSRQSRLLLLDEPTASITDNEANVLFDLLRQLRDQGTAILFVSHKLEEVLSISDRLTVLRDGSNVVVNEPIKGITKKKLISLMIGREEKIVVSKKKAISNRQVKFEFLDVSTAFGHKQINFKIYRGEVLGWYGLVGAGRSELARAVIGDVKMTQGQMKLDGKPVRIRSITEALNRYRIGYLSEDRKGEGLILQHSIGSNIAITAWRQICKWLGFLNVSMELEVARPLVDRLKIKASNLEQAVENLSGGNQQKVSIAKWLAGNVEVLVIDEPTVGVDIKTKNYIHQLIGQLAESGISILLISSDMPEIITIADRIMVMNDFSLVGEFDNDHDYERSSGLIINAIHKK